jgi:pimeloyl-ACP methyl ester carboxylesterase
LRGAARTKGVVLFVHGAGTPAEVAFDVPFGDYSWMGYLADAGYDVFSMDTEGYGRSTRPAVMNDPCNLPKEAQAEFVPSLIPAPCEPSYPHQLTTIASDWADIDAVVDYVRALRGVPKVSLVGWSLGGPRAGGYAGQHPEKVEKLILFAPAYNRSGRAEAPPLPAPGTPMTKQSRQDFLANWDRQVGCPNQYEPAVAESVWTEMLASDPVGATWGPGIRRAPATTSWGWTPALVGKTTMPTLLLAGALDRQVSIDRVRELYQDLGATDKVFVDLACSSHNAMWEMNHRLMFRASLEWLEAGTVDGKKTGLLQKGY